MNWSLSGFYNSKRDRQLLDVNTQVVNSQKDVFVFNTNLTLKQQEQEVDKFEQLIKVDDQIITLRTRIKSTSQSQHENGVKDIKSISGDFEKNVTEFANQKGK